MEMPASAEDIAEKAGFTVMLHRIMIFGHCNLFDLLFLICLIFVICDLEFIFETIKGELHHETGSYCKCGPNAAGCF